MLNTCLALLFLSFLFLVRNGTSFTRPLPMLLERRVTLHSANLTNRRQLHHLRGMFKSSGTRIQMIQSIFAASCAFAVFSYVWNNIDEIKAKQAVAMEKAITKQTNDIQSAQEKQKRDIAEVQRKQAEEIERIRRLK